MNEIKEKKLRELRQIKETAQIDLKQKHGYEDYNVKNVIRYNKEVELINKKTKQIEQFVLTTIILEDPKKRKEAVLYYLNGKEIEFTDLIRDYESPTPIKDVIDKTRENESKPKKEQNKELTKDSLEELEEENEKDKNVNEKKEKNINNDLTGKKPNYVMQTIDVGSTYIDNWTTVSRGFNLPPQVKYIAIARPMQKDEKILSPNMTMYMLDARGNIIENVNGKAISDYFEIDNATGDNPMYDDNTKIELEGYAEKNQGQTMRRFKSKENPDLYLSIEQKKVGNYHEIYVGKRTMDGNDPVEVQLETRNVKIQTDLEMQKIVSGYKGIYNTENIDKEADMHKAHGDDEMKIAIENADGKEYTAQICDNPYIPGTEMTWEELSEETGEDIKELQERFERELKGGKEPTEIVDEIEYDYEMVGPNKDRR